MSKVTEKTSLLKDAKQKYASPSSAKHSFASFLSPLKIQNQKHPSTYNTTPNPNSNPNPNPQSNSALTIKQYTTLLSTSLLQPLLSYTSISLHILSFTLSYTIFIYQILPFQNHTIDSTFILIPYVLQLVIFATILFHVYYEGVLNARYYMFVVRDIMRHITTYSSFISRVKSGVRRTAMSEMDVQLTTEEKSNEEAGLRIDAFGISLLQRFTSRRRYNTIGTSTNFFELPPPIPFSLPSFQSSVKRFLSNLLNTVILFYINLRLLSRRSVEDEDGVIDILASLLLPYLICSILSLSWKILTKSSPVTMIFCNIIELLGLLLINRGLGIVAIRGDICWHDVQNGMMMLLLNYIVVVGFVRICGVRSEEVDYLSNYNSGLFVVETPASVIQQQSPPDVSRTLSSGDISSELYNKNISTGAALASSLSPDVHYKQSPRTPRTPLDTNSQRFKIARELSSLKKKARVQSMRLTYDSNGRVIEVGYSDDEVVEDEYEAGEAEAEEDFVEVNKDSNSNSNTGYSLPSTKRSKVDLSATPKRGFRMARFLIKDYQRITIHCVLIGSLLGLLFSWKLQDLVMFVFYDQRNGIDEQASETALFVGVVLVALIPIGMYAASLFVARMNTYGMIADIIYSSAGVSSNSNSNLENGAADGHGEEMRAVEFDVVSGFTLVERGGCLILPFVGRIEFTYDALIKKQTV